MNIEYQKWGLAENTVVNEAIVIKPLLSELSHKTLNIIDHITHIKDFSITSAALVEHYQGKNISSKKLALLRLERNDGKNSGLRGEHISATIDINTLQLIGFTRMEKHLSGEISISHQDALNQAIQFLKIFAPDLISEETISPKLNFQISNLKSDSKLEFNTGLPIGKTELHWIGQHTEEIISHQETSQKEKIQIHGMKVKMYIPETKLWAWVIIDNTGDILTFERDIFWNFDQFKRETQMWLHDSWIEAHNIIF